MNIQPARIAHPPRLVLGTAIALASAILGLTACTSSPPPNAPTHRTAVAPLGRPTVFDPLVRDRNRALAVRRQVEREERQRRAQLRADGGDGD